MNEQAVAAQDYLREHVPNEGTRIAAHRRPQTGTDAERIEELERENARLQLLVAELLIKNQQLRKSAT